MAAGFPSGSNTFVPSHEASGSLIVGFSRNPKKFKLNRYVKIVPVKKGAGYYLKITAEEAARVINANLNDFVWHDGQEAPMGNDNLESFEYAKYVTRRVAYPYTLGDKAVDQADWNVLAVHAGIAGQKAMTARTLAVWNILGDSANWGTSYGTATALGGGKWDVSGATDLFIKNTFDQVAENILKATLGVVQPADLICVMSPNVARQAANSAEIRDFIKQSPYSLAQVRGDVPGQNGRWGLPDTLYGIQIEVEDAVRVTSKKGATRASGYCVPAGTAVFLARPGELVGMEGIPEFSTLQLFMYEEFTVESKKDPDNRRTVGRIVEDFDVELVAPAAGYLVTACVD